MYLNHIPAGLNQDQEVFKTEEPSYAVTNAEDFFENVMFNEFGSSTEIEPADCASIKNVVCDGEWLSTKIGYRDATEDDVQRAAEMIYEACNA